MSEFNPLKISDELKALYKQFILTSFPIKDKTIKDKLSDLIDNENILSNGPLISLASNYKKGQDAREFLKKLDFHEGITNKIEIDRLFSHQEEAIKSIRNEKNTIVSTGTGSGKTETFILPIIDYCLKNREKGLKAIIIYPMNALANDQLLRLRTILYKINSEISDPITVGIYNGQTPENEKNNKFDSIKNQKCKLENTIMGTLSILNCPEDCNELNLSAGIKNNSPRLVCDLNPSNYDNNFELVTREQIRNTTPDILITNYVQLEYLLLRPEDSSIFNSNSFKYLVFDEVHWYTGATGAEVALLIRRLKSRLNKYSSKKIISIGTSATLSSTAEAHKDIANFTSDFFGEEIKEDNVITGEKEKLEFKGELIPSSINKFSTENLNNLIFDPKKIIEMSEDDFKNYCSYFSDKLEDCPKGDERLFFVGELLSENKIFSSIANEAYGNPISPENLCKNLFKFFNKFDLESNVIKKIIWTYLYAGSISLTNQKNIHEPLIRPQIHVFFKNMGNSWPYGEIYSCVNPSCHELYTEFHEKCVNCNSSVEELGVCRFCGEVYLKAAFEENPSSEELEVDDLLYEENSIYLKKIKEDIDNKNNSWQVFKDFGNPENKGFREWKKCIKCGSLNSLSHNKCHFCDSTDLILTFTRSKVNTCPFCTRNYGGGREAVSSLYISPSTTSRLIFDLNYILLRDRKKMLIFSDSRQDASFMAGSLEEEHFNQMIRQEITQQVQKNDVLKYEEFEDLVWNELKELDDSLNSQEDEIRKDILATVSSSTAKQRSPENLGLIHIDYHKIMSLDVSDIAEEFNLPESLFKMFLISILDIIRKNGALEGLHDIRTSGYSKPTGYICKPQARKSENYYHKVLNLLSSQGTPYLYVKKALPDEDPAKILNIAFKILIENNYLKEVIIGRYHKNNPKAFVVNKNKILLTKHDYLYKCNKCLRIFSNLPNDACPGYLCDGEVKRIDAQEYDYENSFYSNFYRNIYPLRLKVNEDTGYIPIDERQKSELAFRSGKIDLLVATPTLELGIDIGDLGCVALMKSPPSPSNFAQRVGRAGRKTQISMSTSFMFQSPIDRYYFDYPEELISGEILAPSLNIHNPYIVERHVNSLILENLMVMPSSKPSYYTHNVNSFIDEDHIDSLLESYNSNLSEITDLIKTTFSDVIFESDENIVKNFPKKLENSLKFYKEELDHKFLILSKIREEQDMVLFRRKKVDNKDMEIRRLSSMNMHIMNSINKLQKRSFFSHLSTSGVTPRYAFPGNSLKIVSEDGEEYSDRQMPIALYELAPGMPIYLKGLRKNVIGLSLGYDPELIESTKFYVCKNCRIFASDLPFDTCPECKEPNTSEEISKCYSPKAVIVRGRQKPKTASRERFFANTEVFLMEDIYENLENNSHKTTDFGKIKLLGQKKILTVVDGISKYDDLAPRKFNLCGDCGYYLGGTEKELEKTLENPHRSIFGKFERHNPSEIIKNAKLFHKFSTSVILIEFSDEHDLTFLVTFKNALINAAQRIVGAEDGEIEGIIKDSNIILYDNIEGSAGYVNTIYKNYNEVITETKNLILNCKCEKGCIKCLYSYRRQRDISKIDKRSIIDFIKKMQCTQIKENIIKKGKKLSETIITDSKLDASSKEFKLSGDAKCIFSNAGSYDGAVELRDSISSAKDSVSIISLYISDTPILWENGKTYSWYDILVSCKMNGVKTVRVIVRKPKEYRDKYLLERLRRRGIEVLLFEGSDNEPAIAHHKIAMIDEETKHGISILQSANFSREVVKNADFFIFLTNKENKSNIMDIKEWINNISRRCTKFSIQNS